MFFSDGTLKMTGVGEVIADFVDAFHSTITGTITLGPGITAIGYWRFHHLQSWVSLVLPRALVSIHDYCF
jgi:hypothetical protein